VAGRNFPLAPQDGWSRFDLPSLLDHEVAVIE
jgi:hypothetical protein